MSASYTCGYKEAWIALRRWDRIKAQGWCGHCLFFRRKIRWFDTEESANRQKRINWCLIRTIWKNGRETKSRPCSKVHNKREDGHPVSDCNRQTQKKNAHPVVSWDNPNKIPVDASCSCNLLPDEEKAYDNRCWVRRTTVRLCSTLLFWHTSIVHLPLWLCR